MIAMGLPLRDGDRFIPALDHINEFAELRLDF